MNAILRTVLQRLALGVVTLFVVSALISASVALLPGDFAKAILGQAATPETVAAFEKQVGLDRSPVERYVGWIGGVLHGDFGISFANRDGYTRTVVSLIAPRLKNTLFLASMAAIVAVPLALILGMLAALYRNTIFRPADQRGHPHGDLLAGVLHRLYPGAVPGGARPSLPGALDRR